MQQEQELDSNMRKIIFNSKHKAILSHNEVLW